MEKKKYYQICSNNSVELKFTTKLTNERGTKYFSYSAKLYATGQMRIQNPAYDEPNGFAHYFVTRVDKETVLNPDVSKFYYLDIKEAFERKAEELDLPGYKRYDGDTSYTYVNYVPSPGFMSHSLVNVEFNDKQYKARFLVKEAAIESLPSTCHPAQR